MQTIRVRTIISITILFLSFGVVSKGQEPPKAVLIDEFGTDTGCEDLSARLDSFISELSNNPEAIGHVIIGHDRVNPRRELYVEKFIDGYARYRNLDEGRLNPVRHLSGDSRTRFWLVPPGTDFEIPSVSYDFPSSGRKIRLSSDMFEYGPCYTSPPFRLLSKYLSANTGTVANIAIGAPSRKAYGLAKAEIIKLFETTYKVRASRIRFFRAPGQYYSNAYELWLLKKTL